MILLYVVSVSSNDIALNLQNFSQFFVPVLSQTDKPTLYENGFSLALTNGDVIDLMA
jgi:hypothetical protein